MAWNIVIVLTVIACLLALAISVYPGVLNDLLFLVFLVSFFVVPVVGIIGMTVLIVLGACGKLQRITIPWRRVAVVAVLLFGSYVLLKFYIPRRIAFAFSRPAFEPYVAQAPISDCQGTTLNKRLGVYRVNRYAADPRGGVYFRVFSGNDSIGPDCMSYGFVYKPNAEGTPFGAASYQVFSLDCDWYWFLASDDWY